MEIKLNNVTYKDKLKNINYEFEEEKITSVLGNSGSGKTLLSQFISGINNDYTGTIDNTYKGRNIGYVPSNNDEIFIGKTVREELSFGLEKYNYKISTINKRLEDVLKMVNLPISYLDKNPLDLSSGEKKALSLAVILILNPKIIIIDDPTINIDNGREEHLIKLLKKLKNRYHKTIILFTSDIEFSIKVSDNYLLLKKGKIVSFGNKKDLLNNCNKLKNSGLDIPMIIDFIDTVKKKKNINLDYTFDIKELMKDVYRNVQ